MVSTVYSNYVKYARFGVYSATNSTTGHDNGIYVTPCVAVNVFIDLYSVDGNYGAGIIRVFRSGVEDCFFRALSNCGIGKVLSHDASHNYSIMEANYIICEKAVQVFVEFIFGYYYGDRTFFVWDEYVDKRSLGNEAELSNDIHYPIRYGAYHFLSAAASRDFCVTNVLISRARKEL